MEHKVVLGYWGLRGLGEQLRHILNFCGIEFEDKRYMSRETWAVDKAELSKLTAFPNLPYLKIGDMVLTES